MACVFFPLILGTLLTCAGMVIVGLTFNFANVIGIPLMLGIGIDTGIHLVHRSRVEGAHGEALLRTGTTRAVIYSNLTTMASFGSLSVSTHLGMASLGKTLFIAILFILFANLVVLPALLEGGLRRESPQA
jgi:predicted RND superfamily exporter protein